MEQFVNHAAGLAGLGQSVSIDAVILRDDHEQRWDEPADGALERRVYYAQNWRADVIALLGVNGRVLERVWYEAYGTPNGSPPADLSTGSNAANDDYLVLDGDYDSDDQFVFNALFGASDPRADLTGSSTPASFDYGRPDGSLDSDDSFYYLDLASSAETLGRGALSAFASSDSLRNRKGLAGYEWDPATSKYHVRHRVLDPETGRWTRRDPLQYVDGASLYQYVGAKPLSSSDSLGLANNDDSGQDGNDSDSSSQHLGPTSPVLPVPDGQSPPTPQPIAPTSAPLQVCCRATLTPDPFTHCELKWGCAPGERGYPVWTVSMGARSMPDGTPCHKASQAQIAECLGTFPGNNRPRPSEEYGYDNNCQSNTRDKLARCCLTSTWRPNVYACNIRGRSRCTKWWYPPRIDPGPRIRECLVWEYEHQDWRNFTPPPASDPRLPLDPLPVRPPPAPAPPGKQLPS